MDAPMPSHRIEVHGYDRLVDGLDLALARGRLTGSFLFVGPPQVGKRTLARRFAQRLLCERAARTDDPANDAQGLSTGGKVSAHARPISGAEETLSPLPCGTCRTCRLVHEGQYADLVLADPPLKIATVRRIQADLALAPFEGPWRIAILPEIERATRGAANALLKTLEEPPSKALLLLTASEAGQVLDTVVSRCRVLRVRALPTTRTARILVREFALDAGRAEQLARLSGGRLGWAIDAYREAETLADRSTLLDALEDLLGADRRGRFRAASALAGNRADLSALLATWSSWWRDLMHLQFDAELPLVNRDRRATLESWAPRFKVEDSLGALRALDATTRQLTANANGQLALEALILELPSDHR